MMEIRRARTSDVALLVPLVEQYWTFERIGGFEADAVRVQLERLLSEPGLGAGWIASVDGSAVGYLLAVYVFSLEHLGLTAEIDELFILPHRRGDGLGTRLLSVAESEFRRRGCTNVSLQLSRKNDSARGFYRHNRYEQRAGYELLDKLLRDG